MGPGRPRRTRSEQPRFGKARASRLGSFLRAAALGNRLRALRHLPRPFRAFQDGRARAFGLQEVDRNTPTVLNARFYRWYGWDSGHDSLWSQSVRRSSMHG